MRSFIVACLCLAFLACGGGPLDVPADAPTCEVVDIASITGCSTNTIPGAMFAQGVPADLTVYLDGKALPRESWEVASNGHAVIITACADQTDRAQHLVSVSVGCVAE